MSEPQSETRALMTVILVLAGLFCLFAGICAMGLVAGEISFGRPLRASFRLAQSPLEFWLVWGIWASLAAASAFGAGFLVRYRRRHRV